MHTREQAATLLAKQGMGDEEEAFLRALIEAGLLIGLENVLRFIEKPWHWDQEFVIWDRWGRPLDNSMDGWDDFYREVTL